MITTSWNHGFAEDDFIFCPRSRCSRRFCAWPGKVFSEEDILLASQLVSRYFDKKKDADRARVIGKHQDKVDIIKGLPFSDEEAKRYLSK